MKRRILIALAFLALIAAVPTSLALPPTLETGDIIVGVDGEGGYWYRSDGTLVQQLVGPAYGGSQVLNIAFTPTGTILIGRWNHGQIDAFDNSGAYLGVFATPGPQFGTIAMKADGTFWLGHYDQYSPGVIKHFDTLGNVIETVSVAGESFLGLGLDGCTLYHANWATPINKIDVCTPGAPDEFFANTPAGSSEFEIRLVPTTSGILVGSDSGVHRYDFAGNLIQTYPGTPGQINFPVALSVDGNSFWTVDHETGLVRNIDIATGAELSSFTSPVSFGHYALALGVFGDASTPSPPVPELATLVLLGSGAVLAGIVVSRRT